jgi:hypothetical protein
MAVQSNGAGWAVRQSVRLRKWKRRAIAVTWVSVVSTVFTSVAYDEGARQLYLTFHSGKTYRYFEFPTHQYDEFLAAESQGKYFRTNIRGKFREEEVRETHRSAT